MSTHFAIAAVGLALFGTTTLAAQSAQEWEIGPTIRGKNYSVGMPRQVTPTRTGWKFAFPESQRGDRHVNAVTLRTGPLDRKSRITIRYRIDAARGTQFVPQEEPGVPATVSLFLQRRGDNWSARGKYGFYRWYAPIHAVQQIAPGVHQMSVSLTDMGWTNVVGSIPARSVPEAYRAALSDAYQIGLVFGTTTSRGHGVYATGPATFELLSFKLE